jgi:hypothetical protein
MMSVISSSITLFAVIVSFYLARKKGDSYSIYFLILAISFRYILSFNYEVTFAPALAGQSINSLFSLFSTIIGLLIMKKDKLLSRKLISYYFLCLVVTVSALITREFSGYFVAILKWLYFLVLTSILVAEFGRKGIYSTLVVLFPIFVAVFISQVFSIVLDQYIVSDELEWATTYSISYIAGYGHESAFSLVMLTALLISIVLLLESGKKIYLMFILLFFVGIVYANYRTSLIASFLMLLGLLVAVIFTQKHKINSQLLFLLGFIVFIAGWDFFGVTLIERFDDFFQLMDRFSGGFILDPMYFSQEDKQIMSARLYIWNIYIADFKKFDLLGQIFGVGPESWIYSHEKYAHNEFVSYLYEYGYIGLFALSLVCISLFKQALSIKIKRTKIFAVFVCLSYLSLMMATMPLWSIEGVILLAIIWSYVWKSGLYVKN